MALNWDITKVYRHKNLYRKITTMNNEGFELKEPYSTIIILTITIGINNITEENHLQFYNRVNLIEKLYGPLFYKSTSKKPVAKYVTVEDVKRMIGLKTNAANISKAKFLKNQLSNFSNYNI
jgi:hypothetical protein